jgi:nitroimidazol reductase NimA-like FMN-containing flavoprotein (pyridoxamine 5'-phosphate oxidase superfamily)
MLDIDEMSLKEVQDLLQKVGHGHLGCVDEGKIQPSNRNFIL